jgi:hypothetical protein
VIGYHTLILRGPCCKSFVLDVHATTEDKIDDKNISFYEELERVFDKFPKYHIKILLGNFKAEVGRENIFKQTTGDHCLFCDIQKSDCQKYNVTTS